ncbi:TfuA-like protein [Paralimibaculum aggregatum]|uniref:TfuA-like protein n=1 Tax=Paralimibaculum aggregatum TaxID=3036245 RepID=A0ABQ6LGG4_9RHOB|nr:TfuA-like protein [Limibaculum sp. NKW23]GMG81506.1 TfuA-like protein [Limibaculum sp. NKW23]
MTVCVFLGPTLGAGEAAAVLDAVYLPPVRRGALEDAVRAHGADTVAVIDGYFEQVPAVWHKEILWALGAGVDVWGAASMGALRAAELAQFGMRGHGRIYESYRSGRFAPFETPFEDDDEVAVVHGPAGLEAVSTVAMVDIRATLAAAAEDGAIGLGTCRAMAAAIKALFYKERTWARALAACRGAGIPAGAVAALERRLPEGAVWQKRRDALALLALLAAGPPPAPPPRFRFERTLLWEIAHGRYVT